jgi:signal transduction histidine kinase
MTLSKAESSSPVDEVFAGGGPMGALARRTDWAATPIGPVEDWPQSLRTAVSICLASRFPMVIWWGDDLIQIYNNGYRPFLGIKHPQSLGQPAYECWAEIWDVVGPLCEHVRATGESTWSEDLQLLMERFGFTEETYFTFSYSAIRDEAGDVGGILVTCVETTERVLGERRLRTLRELGVHSGEAKTVAEAASGSARSLAGNSADVPFALLYLIDRQGSTATLAGFAGLQPGEPASPNVVSLDTDAEITAWPFASVVHSGQPEFVTELSGRFDGLPSGPWVEPVETAAIIPVARPGQAQPAAVLVVGVSPVRPLDEAYRAFLGLIANHIATAIANGDAHEEERRRVEAMAELDRAKTAFFSNVSHEFRTPLTLLLGPIEELLATSTLGQTQRDRLELAHRNALRLLKLVNTLLDFSRIEAGRLDASFEPTDIATLTAELASVFRSTCERAGIQLVVDCAPTSQPVHADRDMWEKIVLNLMSNAFKFTFEGTITVRLHEHDGYACLEVCDTGTGIPPEELPHIFARFHRVKGAKSRTYEGTGIGLALVQELVRIHNGRIEVQSEVDKGSCFRVSIPADAADPAHDRAGPTNGVSTAIRATAFTEEALRWISEPSDVWPEQEILPSPASSVPLDATPSETTPARIVIADDNADMRLYLVRLLSERWTTEAFPDGRRALEAIRARPTDVVIADIMMPDLDGFELLRLLRSNEATREIPILLLSARAGEEAKVEGLERGADDYLVKPFSARELLARVSSHLGLSRMRREAAETQRRARLAAEEANRAKSQFLSMMSHELRTPLNAVLGYVDLLLAEIKGPLTPDQRAHVERIKACAAVQLELVDEVLTFARIEAGKEEVRLTSVDVRTSVGEAADLVRPLFEQKGLGLRLEMPDHPVQIVSDPARVRQIILNLASNAVKFTEAGEAKIGVKDLGESVIVEVIDTGPGISPDKLDAIFEPFMRVDQSNTRSGGTGLGLAISLRLALMLEGDLSVESQLGRGSKFTLRLPSGGTASP